VKNRAKCRLCGDILESFHRFDEVFCNCGEISISGGDQLLITQARDYKNFLRIDDEGNEIIVKVVDSSDNSSKKNDPSNENAPIGRQEKLEMLDGMIKNIENLPHYAMTSPVTQYDLYSFMLLVSSILKE
jgi:hypothetical protein